jgi:hypothetical protein
MTTIRTDYNELRGGAVTSRNRTSSLPGTDVNETFDALLRRHYSRVRRYSVDFARRGFVSLLRAAYLLFRTLFLNPPLEQRCGQNFVKLPIGSLFNVLPNVSEFTNRALQRKSNLPEAKQNPLTSLPLRLITGLALKRQHQQLKLAFQVKPKVFTNCTKKRFVVRRIRDLRKQHTP